MQIFQCKIGWANELIRVVEEQSFHHSKRFELRNESASHPLLDCPAVLPSWGDGVLTSWEIGSVGNTSGEISLNFLKFGVIWGVVMFGQVGLKARSSTQVGTSI